jgi:hypothetical protein
MKCHRLRVLYIAIDGERDIRSAVLFIHCILDSDVAQIQKYFIDTLSQRPELKMLRCFHSQFLSKDELSDLRPTKVHGAVAGLTGGHMFGRRSMVGIVLITLRTSTLVSQGAHVALLATGGIFPIYGIMERVPDY